MNRKRVEKGTSVIGLVSNFAKTEDGYSLSMLSRGEENEYPCTQDVYDYIYNGRVGVYPNVLELVYILIFDPNGVVVQLLQADGYENAENCLIESTFSIATAMMSKPPTETTPRVGAFFKIENNQMIFSPNYDDEREELCYQAQTGPMEAAAANIIHQMAEGFDIYTWKWATKGFFEYTTPEELDGLDYYVPGFELGTLEDVYSCHWIWFGSLKGDDSKWDTICAFCRADV